MASSARGQSCIVIYAAIVNSPCFSVDEDLRTLALYLKSVYFALYRPVLQRRLLRLTKAMRDL